MWSASIQCRVGINAKLVGTGVGAFRHIGRDGDLEIGRLGDKEEGERASR